ncbi:MAG TPA: selenocysteine-specific translation elongation factor [Candidatus Eremiobacteraceae bacterium]|nr:selenocysteine-specific translation elongation factor [Candidatus Eremiobacteraceae bacterium]
MRIVGTAGHVDHGKSSLVISLTGHNPDRWVEELERGMTLDLGFAPLRFSDGVEAGIIDVPGHERFIHNMLAGAAGIDVLLLVVDALEGPRAQTREHLQILGFLNVARSIVVLTKIDIADEAAVSRSTAAVRDTIVGTVAADAAIMAVSNATGQGIEELKSAIHDALVALPPRREDAPAFLPIDRVFALPGHGTIVTGTLMQGMIRAGDTLTLQPADRPARVRSLQIFGRKTGSAHAGSRLAINVPGIDASTTRRGDVLAATREFEPSSMLSVEFTPLEGALPLLRRRTAVRVHIGSAEIEGRLVFDERPTTAEPVQGLVELARPTVTYRGARFIVRRLSPKDLLGGGTVVYSDLGERSRFISTAAAGPDDTNRDDALCLEAIESVGIATVELLKIASAANILEAAARSAVGRLVEEGRVVALAKPVSYLTREAYETAFERCAAALRERHARAPWRLGCSASEIASALGIDDMLCTRLLVAWHDDGRIAVKSRCWRLPEFTPTLAPEQQAFFAEAFRVDATAPLVPASYASAMSGADDRRISGTREAFESLVAAGQLVRIGDDVYRRNQFDRARLTVENALANGDSATTSQLRVALGISRKYALPLLEHFDSLGITVRDGDLRRLRASAGNTGSRVQV